VSELTNVCVFLELEPDLAEPAEPEIQLGIEVECACGFDRECPDLALGREELGRLARNQLRHVKEARPITMSRS
jgi:hypothetical protein